MKQRTAKSPKRWSTRKALPLEIRYPASAGYFFAVSLPESLPDEVIHAKITVRFWGLPATDAVQRKLAREAEGAPLLREYRVKSSIEGSNPSVSASCFSILLMQIA